mgnify:CR=1 FL=1
MDYKETKSKLAPAQIVALKRLAKSHKTVLNSCSLWSAAGKHNKEYRQCAIQLLTGEPKPRPKAKCGISVYIEEIQKLTGIDFDDCSIDGEELFFSLYS